LKSSHRIFFLSITFIARSQNILKPNLRTPNPIQKGSLSTACNPRTFYGNLKTQYAKMHPVDAVLAREGAENDAGQRKKYTSLHEDFHRALRIDIFPW
jgi:hypothetical protein